MQVTFANRRLLRNYQNFASASRAWGDIAARRYIQGSIYCMKSSSSISCTHCVQSGCTGFPANALGNSRLNWIGGSV